MTFNLDDYEPVEDRLAKFKADYPVSRIDTELHPLSTDGFYIVKATLWRDLTDEVPSATGFAQEREGSNSVNRTSALENCETSAIGRALANLGYASKGKRPSREEMTKAAAQTSPPKQTPRGDVSEPTHPVPSETGLGGSDAAEPNLSAEGPEEETRRTPAPNDSSEGPSVDPMDEACGVCGEKRMAHVAAKKDHSFKPSGVKAMA